jgi:hypothetical protein
MKSILILLSVLMIVSGEKLNYWDEHKVITWDDFKKVRKLSGNEAAKIHVATSSSFEYEDGYLVVEVRTFMDPSRSFVLKDEETDHLLLHEQLHFDIQEITARKIRKRIQDGTYKFNSLSRDLNKIIKEELREGSKMQSDYDKESEHSINVEKQKEWEEHIKEMFIEYKEYKDYAFRVKVEI